MVSGNPSILVYRRSTTEHLPAESTLRIPLLPFSFPQIVSCRDQLPSTTCLALSSQHQCLESLSFLNMSGYRHRNPLGLDSCPEEWGRGASVRGLPVPLALTLYIPDTGNHDLADIASVHQQFLRIAFHHLSMFRQLSQPMRTFRVRFGRYQNDEYSRSNTQKRKGMLNVCTGLRTTHYAGRNFSPYLAAFSSGFRHGPRGMPSHHPNGNGMG